MCDNIEGRLVLDETQGKVTGKLFNAASVWLRPKSGEPYLKVNSDGSFNFDQATFDGVNLRLRVSYKLTSHAREEKIVSFVLTFDKNKPNVLVGSRRDEDLNPNGNDALNYSPVRFNREGGPIVRIRDPATGSWIPWVLIAGVGWVLYGVARTARKKLHKPPLKPAPSPIQASAPPIRAAPPPVKPAVRSNKKAAEQPTEYELDIRTQDDRTSLSADGEDILWVYAQVRCNKPEINTQVLTAGLTFTAEGTDAEWLNLGPPQTASGFKTVPVRAWPPSQDAQFGEGRATVIVSALIEGSTVDGSVAIDLEVRYVMEFAQT